MSQVRQPAVAGSWYPARPDALRRDVEGYLARAAPASVAPDTIRALIAPHAGLMFSGGTAAAAYAAVRDGSFETIVLVGPSHYVGFNGVAVWPDGAFDTPLGRLPVHEEDARRLLAQPFASARTDAHAREHSLELQLPFIAALFPDTPILPIVMGEQVRETVDSLAAALVDLFRGRQVLLVASSDLSHFFDAGRAEALDGRVEELVAAFDPDGLMDALESYPLSERGRYVMCGGGPAVAVMRAARALDARRGLVLARSHSGQISGDNERVVGYLAAVFARGPAS
jgi:AmmeMemoRadiSam system protein B